MPYKDNIYIGNTETKGRTYYAKKDFAKGDIVYCFEGPIVATPTDYTCPIGNGEFINPTEFGGKYTNDYGFEANLGIKDRVKLVAMRDIIKDEEVGPAYFMFVPFYSVESEGNRLNLSCFEELSDVDKTKYKEYISSYLFNPQEIALYEKFRT